MARPRKDKFRKAILESTEKTEFEIINVSIPFYVKVTYKEKISEYPDGRPVYGTSDIILKGSIFEEEMIIKEFKEKHLIVIKIEQFTIQFTDICEKCHTKGIPRIEPQPNDYYYHAKAIAPIAEEPKHTNKSNRPDTYWLVYDHKPKKCRIAQFDKNNFLFKPTKNRINELHKHFYPLNLGKGLHGVTLTS